MDMTDYQDNSMSVISSVEFQRNLGLYQDKALAEPVTITKNGRKRLVLISVSEYERLKEQRDGSGSAPLGGESPALGKAAALTKPLKESLKPYANAIRTAFVASAEVSTVNVSP